MKAKSSPVKVGIPGKIPAELLEKFTPRKLAKLLDFKAMRQDWMSQDVFWVVKPKPKRKDGL